MRRCSLDGHRKRQQRDRVAAGSAWQEHGLVVTTTIGTPIENIQDVLGHSSPTVTKMIYVEVTEKIQREAIASWYVGSCHDHAMAAPVLARRDIRFGVPVVVAHVLGALVAGALIGVNLPFGSKPLTVARGTAYFSSAVGKGTFLTEDESVSALILPEVGWVDRSGRGEFFSVPSCL